MKGIIYFISLWAFIVLLASCSESLEETYEDYSGDGKIRYLGKCKDVEVTPGWERLHVEWKNGTDAVIDKVKITWEASEKRDSVLVDRGTTSYDIRNLENDTYRVDVCSIDKNGNTSLVETGYARPYTYGHEAVTSFTRLVTKHYEVENDLVFFMEHWNDSIVKASLQYTNLAGETDLFPLTKDLVSQSLITLKGVNFDKPITILREGKLEGCSDTIIFPEVALGNELMLTSDFKQAIQRRYGFKDETPEDAAKLKNFIDTVRILEFDYDMTSFEDVLYCPKLEKIVCGKNRYLTLAVKSSVDASKLTDEKKSLMVLEKAHEYRKVIVEQYNDHYFTSTSLPAYIEKKGNPTLPKLTYLSEDIVESIVNTVEDGFNHKSHLEYLLDNDPTTCWESEQVTTLQTHQITIALKEPKKISGIKVVQMSYTEAQDQMKNDKQEVVPGYYSPGQLIVKVSKNRLSWEKIGYMEASLLGRGSGETTLIPMAEPQEIQYIQITVSDQKIILWASMLADIVLYQ